MGTSAPASAISGFEELGVGEERRLTRSFTAADVAEFARISGDANPLHMDEAFARSRGFRGRVVHGALLAAFASQAVGMRLPAGSLWVRQSFSWRLPVYVGDVVTLVVRVASKSPGARALSIEVAARNQAGDLVMDGDGVVKVLGAGPPAESLLAAVRKLVAEVFGVGEQDVTPESSPETIAGWDSLQHLNLVLALEQEFQIQFTPEEIELLQPVKSIAALTERKIAAREAADGR